MKFSRILTHSSLAIALAANLTACGEKHSDEDGHGHGGNRAEAHSDTAHSEEGQHEEDDHGVEFQEGKGLHVPDDASKMLGVKKVEVEEGSVSAPIDLALRVFQSGGSSTLTLASGSISTNDAALLKEGQEVQISGGKAITGTIKNIQNLSSSVGLAEVVVELPASSGLETGTFLDATATVTTAADAVIIPRQALLETAEGQFVYVVNGDHLFRTAVKVGLKGSETIEVTEGLYTGDQVVLQPVMPLWLAELQSIRGGQSCADGH